MLTEQNVIMELTDTSDTVPIGFITTDDGHTLLAIGEHEDGTLEFMATPIALMPQNNIVSSALIKTVDGSFILHPPVFQLNADGLSGTVMQQTNLSPLMQSFENGSVITEQLKVQDTNEYQVSESLLSSRDNSNVLSNKGQLTVDNHAKSISTSTPMVQNVCKRAPGRPKKTEVTSQNKQSLKCDICRQEFTKQTLYRRHMENHAEEKPHRCPKCSASFNIPTNFTLHMATHNIGDPKCPECGRKYARMASLKSHMLLHEKEENLFCTECEDAFSTKAQLDAHLKLHGEKWVSEDVRKCKLCNKQFVQPALYRMHIREHYRLQTKIVKQTKRGTKHKTMYKCTICLKSFQKPSQLMRHIRVHTGEKPFKCTTCNRAFTQKSSLQIHTWQHKGIRPHTCSLCNAKFSQKGNLKAHILRVHNASEGEPTYACSYCSCIFKKLGSLNGHIKRMHSVFSEESVAKSSEANSNISSEADMRATVDSVISQLASLESVVSNNADSTKTTTLSVEQNDILQQALKNSGLNKNEGTLKETTELKKTDLPTSYVTLLDKTAGGTSRKYLTIKQRCVGNIRWYACSYCPKEFKKPSDLIRHLRVHTQEKPFKCMYCVRSFALKSTMIAHERTHTGVKKYACDSCSKTFACHSSLTAHAKLHTKPHKCNICDKSFSASTILKNHMKSHVRQKAKISPEAENLIPQVVLQEPLVISDAGNKISVMQVQSKQKELCESVGVARPHECCVCHAAFRKVSHLKQHFRRHTGERPYKCPKCDRRFTSNSVLKSHLHTHDDARPYSCAICDTKFSTQSSMKRHLVTHSNKRPYMCPYCNKTFKTKVNCRKHIKRHKHELAQQQLEKQKTQNQKEPQTPLSENKGATSTLPESITLTEDMDVSFQPQMAPDFTQAFSDQFQNISAEKEKSFLLSDNVTPIVNQNLSVDATNLETTQTLHADETGTITLPHYSGDQTLTPESIREIEETLNQQLFNINMNLGLGANNLSRQMDETNTNSLNNSREQPVLNIIYEHNKNLESSGNTIFMSQFDSFDMNQITLQTDNDMDIALNPSNSTNISSILPRSVANQQEEQQIIPLTASNNIDASQITRNAPLVVISSPKENCSELVKFSQVCPSKYSKVIAKADTTNGSEIQNANNHEKIMQKSKTALYETNEKNHLFMKNFQNVMQPDMLVSSGVDNSTKISECNTLLQCHMCDDQGFTTERLKEHLKSHRGAKEYECSECSQRFYTNGGLTKHMKMHTNKQRWKCAVCQKTLSSKLQLKFHSKMHDMIESWNNSSTEPDSSQKDPLAFSNSELSDITKLGVQINSNPSRSVSEKVLMDAVAEKKIMDHADENAEKKETKEYTNKCKYCPKTFRKPSDLIRHIRTHTGERPYKCEHCNKSFAVKCTLDSHMKVHTGKKTFCCHVCSSMFATKGSLKVHMRLHTGSKPFKCPVCDLRFRTSGHKKVHMLKHAREHKGGVKRKPKHSKVAAVAEAAACLEKIGNGSLDNVSTTTTMTSPSIINEIAPSQNLDYPRLEQTVNLGTTVHLPNQIAFNHADASTTTATTIFNNNSMLSMNENNELVANLQFLLANGLVTIQTDDTLLTQPATSTSDTTGTGVPTNVIELVNPDPFQEACNLDNANHMVITNHVPTDTTTADANNATVIEMNNCMSPVSVQIQTEDIGADVSEVKMSDQLTTPTITAATPTIVTVKSSTQPSRKECDICGKTFMKPYQMERHKRIHTGERPYKCEQCGKSFAQKFTLHLHQKRHTGDRPYSCPHCKHFFTQKCNLQTHLKRVHQLVMLDVKKVKSDQQMLGALLQDNQSGDAKLNLDEILVVNFLK